MVKVTQDQGQSIKNLICNFVCRPKQEKGGKLLSHGQSVITAIASLLLCLCCRSVDKKHCGTLQGAGAKKGWVWYFIAFLHLLLFHHHLFNSCFIVALKEQSPDSPQQLQGPAESPYTRHFKKPVCRQSPSQSPQCYINFTSVSTMLKFLCSSWQQCAWGRVGARVALWLPRGSVSYPWSQLSPASLWGCSVTVEQLLQKWLPQVLTKWYRVLITWHL